MQTKELILVIVMVLLIVYLCFFGKKGGFLLETFYLRRLPHAIALQNGYVAVLVLALGVIIFLGRLQGEITFSIWSIFYIVYFGLLFLSLLLHGVKRLREKFR